MLYVIDTHVLVWYFTGNKRLHRGLKNLIEETRAIGGHLIVPTIVLAEAFYIHLKDPTLLDYPDMYRRILQEESFEVVDFTKEVMEEVTRVAMIDELHDRIIVASARHFSAGVLTRDEVIRESGEVETL